ncbi:hypothetical protein [uncultured Vagococcus sp.]|uniref:hypothetical protein n=1 Tax=uncultured Vagococcus sp. TaxID=189676 RepID=UPI0028D21A45|nr:hypothetical protein [uncultured Vagococcus sp.]
MKKMSIVIGALVVSIVMLMMGSVSEGVSKETISKIKNDLRRNQIQLKLEVIRQKAGEEVRNRVAEQIQIKEAKLAEQKVINEKAEHVTVEQDQAEYVTQSAIGMGQAVETAETSEVVDVTSGASQSGREIGERNREYGQQLSDPNLSQGERQQIIQEKKEYNQGRR